MSSDHPNHGGESHSAPASRMVATWSLCRRRILPAGPLANRVSEVDRSADMAGVARTLEKAEGEVGDGDENPYPTCQRCRHSSSIHDSARTSSSAKASTMRQVTLPKEEDDEAVHVHGRFLIPGCRHHTKADSNGRKPDRVAASEVLQAPSPRSAVVVRTGSRLPGTKNHTPGGIVRAPRPRRRGSRTSSRAPRNVGPSRRRMWASRRQTPLRQPDLHVIRVMTVHPHW